MLRNLKKREGFTLIELMIVVAIIGILAAIAIPNFIKFQLRSKASESKINLAAIRTSEESYFAEAGTYLDWVATPAALPGQQKVVFTAAGTCPTPLTPGTDPGFCFVGWQPEGDVYYQYAVVVNVPGGQSNSFVADAVADIDGDANLNIWGIQQPDITGNYTAGDGALGCTAGNVMNVGDGTAGLLAQVGPCIDVDNGRNRF